MSAVRFPLTGDWLQLTQEQATGGPREWAEAAVERLARHQGGPAGEATAALVDHLEAVVRHYLRAGGVGCLLLVPGGRLPVRAMVRLEAFAGPETAEGFREQCDAMIPPLEWLVDPVDVRTLESAAGPVTRVHVRSADPGADPAPVRDTVYWSWWFPDVPETLLASVAFADVADTGRWFDEVERVVLGAVRTDGPAAADGQVPEGQYAG